VPEDGRERTGFSPGFLAEVVRELVRVERALDRLDARIERAKSPRGKARISEERAQWVAYERRLRRLLR
jgi:hypothetical protein